VNGVKLTEGTTILEGFKEVAKEGTKISYSPRGKISPGTEVAVVVVGEEPYAESNGDRAEEALKLSSLDLNVIKTAISTKGDTPLVLLLTTGRPIALADYIDRFDAVVEAWLPGTEGAGIADVMLEEGKEFRGVLPVTWMWYPQNIKDKFTDPAKVLFPRGTGLKRDGSSILPGGQTSIGTRPAPPANGGDDKEIKTRSGGIDIAAYGGKLEGEYSNPNGFTNHNVSIGKEQNNGAEIGYVEWDVKDWANAKWIVYIRQAGQYKLTARMKVDKPGNDRFKFYNGTKITGDGDEKNQTTIPSRITEGYEVLDIGTVSIGETGIHGIKVMDGAADANWTATPMVKAKLDYLQFELIPGTEQGAYDTSVDIPVGDPADETAPASHGNVITSKGVEVYMTSTENSQNMSWYKYPTDMKNQVTKKDSLDITSVDDQNFTTIYVEGDKTYQELLGIGTSLEESTINNLAQLTPEVQDEFLRMLVDPKQGGMTLFRITIGTSDFTAQSFYTYYDARELTAENAIYNSQTGSYEPDWYNTTGKGFSIQKDINYKIVDTVQKVIALAKEYGVEDEVRFFASSWTPPGWMKEETAASKSYKDNDLLLKGGALKDNHIDNLAMYYTRYLEEYAKLGIDIYGMTLQNEPLLEINYPSCAMTGEQEGKLAIAIKKAIGNSTVLSDEAKKCKLWAFDHNPGDAHKYVARILSVPGANEALDGVAFHDYGGPLTNLQSVLDTVLNQGSRKDQTVNLTERSVWGTYGANQIVTYLRNSAISYNSWVTMLDSNVAKHQWVGTPDPTMFARAAGSDNDYWPMPEFYLTGQFARFIRPGYVRVESDPGSVDTITNVVFKNPTTGELVAVVVNQTDRKQNFKFISDGVQFIGGIPAKNVATYLWKNPSGIQNDIEAGFNADQYSAASAGVIADNTEHKVKTASTDDYVDYIINAKEAGLYHVILEQKPSADNQEIEVYQGETLLSTVKATKTWNTARVKVQGTVKLASAGIQQLRIKMSPGVELYRISLKKTDEVYKLPGKIKAAQYHAAENGNGTIEDGQIMGNMGWWTTLFYDVEVPADDTYTFTLSSATEGNDTPVGFIINLDGVGAANEVLMKVNSWTNDYNVSGSWESFTTTSGDINLTKGRHRIGIKIAAPINIDWFSIGSAVELTAPEIIEGQEDLKEIPITITGGKFAASSVTGGSIGASAVTGSAIDPSATTGSALTLKVEGLPEGVTAQFTKTDDTHGTIDLSGNRIVDFDEDKKITVITMVEQPNGNVYPVTEYFIITAVKDSEILRIPEQDLSVPSAIGEARKITLKLEGGTFTAANVNQIVIAGDGAQFYELRGVAYIDAETAELDLVYKKMFYRGVRLEVTVPVSAYEQGDKALVAGAEMQPVDGFPEALVLSGDASLTLTEEKAYANRGSLADQVAAGNYADYFLDVVEAGTYVVTYSMNTLTANGTSYPNAWEINRGVPGSLGTNSYKQVNIPGLWTNGTVKLRHTVELSAGKQTLEFKAKMGGYRIVSIQVEPVNVGKISDRLNQETVIPGVDFYDAADLHVIIGENIEYTVAGSAFDYMIEVEQAGTYQMKMNYAIESSSKVAMKVSREMPEGSSVLGEIKLPATGGWSAFKSSEGLSMELPKGRYTLRTAVVGDGVNIKSLSLTYVKEGGAEEIPLRGITLDKTSGTLKVGETVTLTPSFNPANATDRTLEWSSDHPEIATAAGGVVTAKAPGTAVIKAISKKYPAIFAEFTLTVTKATTPTTKPTESPTAKPTETPAAKPTVTPTAKPTAVPTGAPTPVPGATPVEVHVEGGTVKFAAEAAGEKPMLLIPDSMFIDQMNKEGIDQIIVEVSSKGEVIPELELSKKVLNAAKKSKTDIIYRVNDSSGELLYEFVVSADALTKGSVKGSLSLGLTISKASVNKDIKKILSKDKNNTDGIYLDFTQEGAFPSESGIKLYGDSGSFKASEKWYLYAVNQKTKKLESIPFGTTYRVNKKGYIEFPLLKGGSYVLLSNQPSKEVLTPLRDQIKVDKEKTLKQGAKEKVKVGLPVTLEQVGSLKEKATFPAKGKAVISYSSSNKSIADVSKSGNITAKKAGVATITVTVKLYTGKTYTYKTKVTIK
jgi:beta-glucosidase